MLYLNVNKDGYLLSVSTLPLLNAPSIETLEGMDLTGVRMLAHRWDGEKLTLDENRLAALLEEETRAEKEQKILELKEALASTDYAVIKIAEGSAAPDEYADIIAQRRAWREEINELGG